MSVVEAALRLPGRIVRRLIRTRFETETLRTWYLDFKYGGSCGGVKLSPYADRGANLTMSADYYHLDKVFAQSGVVVRGEDVLVDIGCGKGRVINYWLDQGYRNRMIGLELDEQITAVARKRLGRYPNV